MGYPPKPNVGARPSTRTRFAGLILFAAGAALSSTAVAETGTLTHQPRFREPPVAVESFDVRKTVSLEAKHAHLVPPCDPPCVAVEELFLTYDGQVPGKTIFMRPGSKRKVHLLNSLTHMTESEIINAWNNTQHPVLRSGENAAIRKLVSDTSAITNLHTHGLHISPQGHSDNVLLKIHRGRSFTYKFELPGNHAPGTHWYHAHLHGSTALQVRGGMAGALIVQEPDGQSLNPEGFDYEERVVTLGVYQGGALAPDSPSGDSELAARATAEKTDPGQAALAAFELLTNEELRQLVAGLDTERQQQFVDAVNAQKPAPSFAVNGDFQPVLELRALRVQRLRIINAGSKRRDYKGIYVENHKMYLAAFDGINLKQYEEYDKAKPLQLAPGNRADVFFIPRSSGAHSLVMEGEVGIFSLDEPMARRKFTQELMTFEVGDPGPEAGLVAAEVDQQLDRFLEALNQNLTRLQETRPYQEYLRPFTQRPTVQREMVFSRVGGGPPGARTGAKFLINGRDYNAPDEHGHMQGHSDYLGKEKDDGGLGPDGESPWPPRAGTDEEWTIVNPTSTRHPFHIHVNPFWVPALGRWQDTIDVPSGGSVTIWHRFSDFAGLFVVHCHILQHEDRGMMINILTVPNGNENPQGYFNQQRNANCRLNNEINGTTEPCNLPEG